MKLKTYIYVRGEYIAFHNWADALPQVEFLKYSHRHLFKWEATLQVSHDDRQLEFFIVQEEIMNFINESLNFKDARSCEVQAKSIFMFLEKKYPGQPYCVNVSEDGENGALVKHK